MRTAKQHCLNIICIILIFLLIPYQNFSQPGANNFPQQAINAALQQAQHPGVGITQKENSQQSNQSLRSIFELNSRVKNNALPFLSTQHSSNSVLIDTVIVGLVPNDTLVITGSYSNNGPVWVLNDGVLIFHNATATIFGDFVLWGSGKIIADSSSFFFPQQYFYQRAIIATQNSNISFSACSLNYGGFSHSLVITDNASVIWNNVFNNDWTTCGLSQSASLSVNGTNLAGEYIISDSSTVDFKNTQTVLLWHHFPPPAILNFSFPQGDSVYAYVFNDAVAGINGINYNISVDSCYEVMWAMMPVNGSDVSISNSTIRAVGLWFQYGDTIAVSGLVNNSTYANFTAPLPDRNLHFSNCTLQTWSLYIFDSSVVDITGCILGEVGSLGNSRVTANNFFCDGSGGYFWSSDTSFTVAVSSSVTSHVRSEKYSILLFAYGSLSGGIASAIGNSVLIVVQSGLPQDPLAYDGGTAWFNFIAQPAVSYVDSMVAVTGSAWIDYAPAGGWLDFGQYRMFYQPQGASVWTPLDSGSFTEVHNGLLATWNTYGLSPGNYQLRLLVINNLGDSVEAVKPVTLLPSILSSGEFIHENNSLKVLPNPCSDGTFFNFTILKPCAASLKIFDVHGKEQIVMTSQKLNAGLQQFFLNTEKWSAGIYFYKLLTDDIVMRGKVMVLK